MPNDTVRAAGTGLPASRRGFLRGLTTLPLIGGGVTLIGQPTAVAEPISRELLESYSAFLYFERRFLHAVTWPLEEPGTFSKFVPMSNAGAYFHDVKPGCGGPEAWRISGLDAQRRAALVLSAVGCDWKAGAE